MRGDSIPVSLAEPYYFYSMVQGGMIAPVTLEWMDSQPASWGEGLSLIISVIAEIRAAKAKPVG